MTPQEKAKELLDKFINVPLLDSYEAKQCALIAVDEIIPLVGRYSDYWDEVKQEIEKL